MGKMRLRRYLGSDATANLDDGRNRAARRIGAAEEGWSLATEPQGLTRESNFDDDINHAVSIGCQGRFWYRLSCCFARDSTSCFLWLFL